MAPAPPEGNLSEAQLTAEAGKMSRNESEKQ